MDGRGADFWAVAVRVLRKKLAAEGISIPQISKEVKTESLQPETLQALYPQEEPLRLSASALNEYFRHQYAYFLKYVLRLQEEWTIHPDARSHGIFFTGSLKRSCRMIRLPILTGV